MLEAELNWDSVRNHEARTLTGKETLTVIRRFSDGNGNSLEIPLEAMLAMLQQSLMDFSPSPETLWEAGLRGAGLVYDFKAAKESAGPWRPLAAFSQVHGENQGHEKVVQKNLQKLQLDQKRNLYKVSARSWCCCSYQRK